MLTIMEKRDKRVEQCRGDHIAKIHVDNNQKDKNVDFTIHILLTKLMVKFFLSTQ
jgi:hypothetical protein